ncbi:unnamed protein product, partial [marine sediment metagenome]
HFGPLENARATRSCERDVIEGYYWKGPPTGKLAKNMLKHFLTTQHDGVKFLLMNIEAIRTKNGFTVCEEFLKGHGKSMVVIDESTCIKNPKAQVTKAAFKLGDLADRRFILSGTPMTQGPLDLFSQLKFLHTKAPGYRTWTAFKTAFAVQETQYAGQRSFQKIVGYRNLDRLTEIMKPTALRLTKEECLDLPAKVWQEIAIEMTSEQQKVYNEMKNHALSELAYGAIVSSTLPLTTIMKLQQ